VGDVGASADTIEFEGDVLYEGLEGEKEAAEAGE
jgi:hypothetical protein